jgi:hypothetical protein
MNTKPAVRSSSARVVPNGYGVVPFIGTENAFYEWQLVWHTAGTPDFHGPSRKLQIPTDSQSL